MQLSRFALKRIGNCITTGGLALFALSCGGEEPTEVVVDAPAGAPAGAQVVPSGAGPAFAIATPANGSGQCMGDDAVEFNTLVDGVKSTDNPGTTLNCTASDISIANAVVSQVFDPTANAGAGAFVAFDPENPPHCNAGESVTFRMTANLTQQANSERQDIGVWIATDGGGAETGVCNHYNLINGATGTTNLDGDQCAGMALGASTSLDLGTLTVPCEPDPETNNLSVGACLSWKVPSDDQECSDNADGTGASGQPDDFRAGTLPSNQSKCNCEPFVVPIVVDQTATIEVKKVCDPTTDTGTFDLNIDGSNAFGDNKACGGTTGTQTVSAGTSTNPGADHTVSEDDFTLANYTSTYACTRNGQADAGLSGTGTTIDPVHVEKDDAIICTFTNVRKGGITIIKNAVPDAAQNFAFTGSGTGILANFSLDDDADPELSNTQAFTNLTPGGTRVITEPAVSGYTLTDIACTGAINSTVTIGAAGGFDEGDNSVSIGVAAGENVSCTFTNTLNGSLTIVKDALPNNALDFAFTGTGAGVSNFNLDDDDDGTLPSTKAFSNLLAGSRTITETAVTGWTLTGVACTGATASTVAITGADADPGFQAGDNAVTVDLATGENVSCTFTNTKQGSLTFVKDTKNPETDAQDFAFTTTGGGLSNFSLDDDADATLSNSQAFTGLLPNGARTATETVSSEWVLTGIACTGVTSSTIAFTGANADPAFQAGDNKVSVGLAAGEEVTCTFTNERKARLIVEKVIQGGGSQLFDYTRNPGGVSFSLTNGGSNNSGYTLLPNTYRVCELNLAVDWAATATLDGNPATLINPNLPLDEGNRCVDVPLEFGNSRTLVWTNVPPPAGGDARTIGYWKNWSSCSNSNGRQYQKATAPGGVGISRTLNGNLPQTIGLLLVDTCPEGVSILSKQNLSGKNMAGDAAYGLAAQLLAAKLNVTAGADACPAATTAITAGQNLLVTVGFNATGTYLKSPSANRNLANSLAATLDSYNNNTLCP